MAFIEPYQLEEMENVLNWHLIHNSNMERLRDAVGAPCLKMIAGEDLTKGDAICIGSDGRAYKASRNDASRMPCIGFAYKDASSGGDAWIQFSGLADLFSGLTVGAKYYVDTNGAITSTKPSSGIIQCVGVAKTSAAIALGAVHLPTADHERLHDIGSSADHERLEKAATTTTDSATVSIWSDSLDTHETRLLEARVVARSSDDQAGYVRRAVVYRSGGDAAILGDVEATFTRESSGAADWDVTISVDGIMVSVDVSGAAGVTVEWSCDVWWQLV